MKKTRMAVALIISAQNAWSAPSKENVTIVFNVDQKAFVCWFCSEKYVGTLLHKISTSKSGTRQGTDSKAFYTAWGFGERQAPVGIVALGGWLALAY